MGGESARPFTIKRFTRATDKFAAVCFIYEGEHFQNLCRVENPDGTFNFSEKCLAQLPYSTPYDGDFDSIGSRQYSAESNLSTSSLAQYRGQDNAIARYEPGQSPMPPFRMFVSHYWLPILISILAIFLSALFIVHYFITPRRSRYRRDMVNQDSAGNLIIGKIKFHPNDVLGTGSKGTYVYRGLFENSQECAIKRIVAQTLTFADREVDFLRSLQHSNLVRYLATENDPQFIFIALELADCTLRSLIEGYKLKEFGLSKEEICKQAALGLQHLHKLDIVHRDLKPENILVSLPKRPNNERYIMITDFGLSKQLTTNSETCHSSNMMRYLDGTQGWMPPELIKAKEENNSLTPSKSADIFSLGCVFYYIIFDGKHPFGNAPNEREDNIKANRNEVDQFVCLANKENGLTKQVSIELRVMGNDLIGAMIEYDALRRPPINSVLKYPLFWTKKQSLQFLSEVSDRLDKDQDGLAKYVERGRRRVFGFQWKECLSEALLRDMTDQKHRSYNERSLQHLLRLIRNKNNHYNDSSAELKLDFGSPPDEFYSYFSSRFPELLIHIYKAMQANKSEPKFRDYYEQDEDYEFPRDRSA